MKRMILPLVALAALVAAVSFVVADDGKSEKPDENGGAIQTDAEIWQRLEDSRIRSRNERRQIVETERKIAKALDSPIDIELDENTTFEELIQMIQDRFPGINVALDRTQESITGVAINSCVTDEPVHYTGIKLRNVLRLLLSEHDMAYAIRNEILVLTSEEEARKTAARGMWLISDLTVDPVPEKTEQPVTTDAHHAALMELIEAVVTPESWDEPAEMMEYYPNICFTPRIFEGDEDSPFAGEATAVLVIDPVENRGGGWSPTYDEGGNIPPKPARKPWRTKNRCRLLRR